MNRGKTVILGIGNILFSDEGVGVHFAKSLKEKNIPENISVVDGSTLGIMSIPLFAGAKKLIIVDAVDTQGQPGEVMVYTKDDIMLNNFPIKLSPHQIGIQETLLISELTGDCPQDITFYGIIPSSYDTDITLTSKIKKSMDCLIENICIEYNIR